MEAKASHHCNECAPHAQKADATSVVHPRLQIGGALHEEYDRGLAQGLHGSQTKRPATGLENHTHHWTDKNLTGPKSGKKATGTTTNGSITDP